MRVLIDINHPAHIHYFKKVLKMLEDDDWRILVVARNDVTILNLLNHYKVNYFIRNKRKKGLFTKIFYIAIALYYNIKRSLIFKPDLYIGFASFMVSFTAFLFRKPSIILDDTEHNSLNQYMYKFFANVILTPSTFNKIISKKQIFFESYMELAYLHHDFSPSKISNLQLPDNYTIIRRIKWDAAHDRIIKINNENLFNELIYEISKYSEIIEISEKESSNYLQNNVWEVHNVISGGHLFWMSRLALWGIFGFVFFVWLLLKNFKVAYKFVGREFQYYYLLSIFAFIALGFMKNINFLESFLVLFIIIPGLYLSSTDKNRNQQYSAPISK